MSSSPKSGGMALRSRRRTPERWHNMGMDAQVDSFFAASRLSLNTTRGGKEARSVQEASTIDPALPSYVSFFQPAVLVIGCFPSLFSSSGPHVPLWSQERESIVESGDEGSTSTWAHLKGDYGNIALLLFLYLLQGIPIGLTASIPLVLQSRHVSYSQQAVFSFAYWPFSLKLLWAPIVDSIFWRKVGRRKSWLVPTQYMIALFMFVLSGHVTKILGDDEHGQGPNVYFLASIFFSFNFLAATQDIAVDGWALTMLSRRNVGYASTCNAVGQTAGFFLGNVVFLSLESADFCNKYLRSVPQKMGVVTLAGDFVYMWAWIFLITTTLVLLLKRERDESLEYEEEDLGVKDTYFLLWKIIKLKPVLTLLFVHLTAKIAFAAADGMTGLKLVELGVPKDKLALIAVPLVPLQVCLPWILGKYTSGPRPLSVYLKAYPFRILLSIIFAFVVYWTPAWQQNDGTFPVLYYTMIVVLYCFHQVTVYSIFVAQMAFHAQISDPLVGGTYMTLMNTLANLGGNWPTTASLSIVDDITWKSCIVESTETVVGSVTPCVSQDVCKKMGGKCSVDVDGYYILSAICAVVGCIWWKCMRKKVEKLQNVEKKNWSTSNNRK